VERARQIRSDLGDPEVLLLGVDRLDYTKGIRQRIRAVGELMSEGRLNQKDTGFIQVATPSRERVDQYRRLRDDIDMLVGRINGDLGTIGHPPVTYLHSSFPKTEMAALYSAADVMIVTPLRDGMNLVAKEYVACRYRNDGALVLSEFAGAAQELTQAYLVNPYDINGLKDRMMQAVQAPPRDIGRRMRAMRKQVFENDISHCAGRFLETSASSGRRTASTRAPSDAAAHLPRSTTRGRLDRVAVSSLAWRLLTLPTVLLRNVRRLGPDPRTSSCSGRSPRAPGLVGVAREPAEGLPGGRRRVRLLVGLMRLAGRRPRGHTGDRRGRGVRRGRRGLLAQQQEEQQADQDESSRSDGHPQDREAARVRADSDPDSPPAGRSWAWSRYSVAYGLSRSSSSTPSNAAIAASRSPAYRASRPSRYCSATGPSSFSTPACCINSVIASAGPLKLNACVSLALPKLLNR
jgi:hypothetical protein